MRIVAESERLIIRAAEYKDKEFIVELYKETHDLAHLYQYDEFNEVFSNDFQKEVNDDNNPNFIIELKESVEPIGGICVQNTEDVFPELGIDILTKYQDNGYGTEAVIAFGNWYTARNNRSALKVRIKYENKRSIHMFEKLGAEKTGVNSFLERINEMVKKSGIDEKFFEAYEMYEDDGSGDAVNEYILKFPIEL